MRTAKSRPAARPRTDVVTKTAKCFKCGAPVAYVFRWAEKTEACLCEQCTPVDAWTTVTDVARREVFIRRLNRSGLSRQPRIVEALGLSSSEPDPERLSGETDPWRRAEEAVSALVSAPPGALLVLSGPSGTGKSTCSAKGSYDTHGRYQAREDWTRLKRYQDTSEIDWLQDHPGVVVLDEVCSVLANGRTMDNSHDMAVVDVLAKGRFARKRSTIITTNACEEDWLELYGTLAQAIWTRSTDMTGELAAGGFVDCSPGVH